MYNALLGGLFLSPPFNIFSNLCIRNNVPTKNSKVNKNKINLLFFTIILIL